MGGGGETGPEQLAGLCKRHRASWRVFALDPLSSEFPRVCFQPHAPCVVGTQRYGGLRQVP